MDSYHFFGYLSTYCTLLPIIPGIFRFRYLANRHRIFLFYIMYGFMSDVFKPVIPSDEIKKWMYHIFVLVETTFLIWFMRQVVTQELVKKILNAALLVFIGFWFVSRFVIASGTTEYSPIFDMSSAIFISAAAAYVLIRMTQHYDDLLTVPDFWFIAGTFIYFFCANFIFGLLGTNIFKEIWFIVNCLNIVVYIIFTRAFLTVPKAPAVTN